MTKFEWEMMSLGHMKTAKVLISPAVKSVPEVMNHFSCSTQPSMKFILLLNLKLLTIAYSFLLNIAEHENSSANKYENANSCWHFHI